MNNNKTHSRLDNFMDMYKDVPSWHLKQDYVALSPYIDYDETYYEVDQLKKLAFLRRKSELGKA